MTSRASRPSTSGGRTAGGFVAGGAGLVADVAALDFTGYESGEWRTFGRAFKLDRATVVATVAALEEWVALDHDGAAGRLRGAGARAWRRAAARCRARASSSRSSRWTSGWCRRAGQRGAAAGARPGRARGRARRRRPERPGDGRSATRSCSARRRSPRTRSTRSPSPCGRSGDPGRWLSLWPEWPVPILVR